MALIRALAGVALLAALAVCLPARAQTPTPSYGILGADRFFALEWQGAERRGKPVVVGAIINNWGIAAQDVRLRVELLDAAGNSIGETIGYVAFDLAPGSRTSFEVPVPRRAPSYRVSVLSFQWRSSLQ